MSRREGIGGSGVFGLVGTTVQCSAGDNSLYCKSAKAINVIMWLVILFGLFLLAKDYLKKVK
jgi:hypothetical protein